MTNYYKFLVEDAPPAAKKPGNARLFMNFYLQTNGGVVIIDFNNLVIRSNDGIKRIPVVRGQNGDVIMIKPNVNVRIGNQTFTFRMPIIDGKPVHDIHWVEVQDEDGTESHPVYSGIHPDWPDLPEKDIATVITIVLGVIATIDKVVPDVIPDIIPDVIPDVIDDVIPDVDTDGDFGAPG